jgi:hypothetical protein
MEAEATGWNGAENNTKYLKVKEQKKRYNFSQVKN